MIILQCLKIQPENAKALYRRGLAHYGNNDLLKAEEDLQKAHSLAGNGKQYPPVRITYNSSFTRPKHQAAIGTGEIQAEEL